MFPPIPPPPEPAPPQFSRLTRAVMIGLAGVVVLSISIAGVLYASDRDTSDGVRPGADAPTSNTADARPERLRTPTADRPLRVWVGGDSLAAGPSWAIFEQARETGVIRPLAEYQVGTGLVRSEYWDWHRHLDGVVRARDPEVVVFMAGANDNQALEVEGTSYTPPAPEWVAEYRRRVAALMDLLTEDGRRAVWIGMPPMEDAEYSEAMRLVGEVFAQEAASRPAVTYVDVLTMFSAPGAPGTYALALPDESGELVDMRLDDGIHLNVDGSQFLGRRVLEALSGFVTLSAANP